MTRLLIVNADDYGLTEGISRGILRAHREGLVTSTSVLAVGPAFAATGPWLRDAERLGVGVHLAVVGEDPPLLTAAEIPTLVDRRGRLSSSWRAFLLRAATGRVDPADLRRELAAQLERVAGLGRPITHLDSHQHVHLWPLVARVVIDLAKAHRIAAIRVPRSDGRRWAGHAVNGLARLLAARATAAGLRFPARFWGFDEAGRLGAADVHAALGRLDGTGELCAHPGERDEPARRYAWGYRWDDELRVLTDPALRRAIAARGVELGTFAALGAAP